MLRNNNSLNIKELQQIEGVMAAGSLSYFESIDSTNTWLMEHGQCGDICISETQSLGRGRRGNTWISPKSGNIYLSLCWCFEKMTENWSLLGLVVGVAIAEALKEFGLTQHGVKWPNDIYWQGRKMGGILIETVGHTGQVIIGIGLNVNMPTNIADQIDQQVISLTDAYELEKNLKGGMHSRVDLICILIKSLNNTLKGFSNFKCKDFNDAWKTWDILQGQQVSFSNQGVVVRGKVVGLDGHGRIGILLGSGETSYFSSADIKLKKNVD